MRARIHCLLASTSPRRSRLLEQLGWRVSLVAAHTDEIWPDLPPGPAAKRVAEDKLFAARKAASPELDADGTKVWLAADTVVVLGERILGKPASQEEAKEMLRALSGRTHQVITGFVVARGQQQVSAAVISLVTMRAYGEEEVAAYVAGGEALDKSGAYAIQSGGTVLSARIDGSLSNIVGLPIAEVTSAVAELRGERS